MKHVRLSTLVLALAGAGTAAAQTSVLLDADSAATGSLLATQPLITNLGTITFDGEVRPTSDPELAAVGSVGDMFDIFTNSEATISFGFDVSAITLIYGGNFGSILLEARDASGAVVDSFFQASTDAGELAGPLTLTGAGIRSLYWIDPGFNFAAIDNVFIETGSIGTNYCGPAVSNSSGSPGVMSASGSQTAADNALTLTATGLPSNQFGIFVTSQIQGFIPGAGGSSNGDICLGGVIGRFNRAGEILATGAMGTISLSPDLTDIPQGNNIASIMAGETWNFQAWHRDGIGLGSNFTDGLAIAFN